MSTNSIKIIHHQKGECERRDHWAKTAALQIILNWWVKLQSSYFRGIHNVTEMLRRGAGGCYPSAVIPTQSHWPSLSYPWKTFCTQQSASIPEVSLGFSYFHKHHKRGRFRCLTPCSLYLSLFFPSPSYLFSPSFSHTFPFPVLLDYRVEQSDKASSFTVLLSLGQRGSSKTC